MSTSFQHPNNLGFSTSGVSTDPRTKGSFLAPQEILDGFSSGQREVTELLQDGSERIWTSPTSYRIRSAEVIQQNLANQQAVGALGGATTPGGDGRSDFQGNPIPPGTNPFPVPGSIPTPGAGLPIPGQEPPAGGGQRAPGGGPTGTNDPLAGLGPLDFNFSADPGTGVFGDTFQSVPPRSRTDIAQGLSVEDILDNHEKLDVLKFDVDLNTINNETNRGNAAQRTRDAFVNPILAGTTNAFGQIAGGALDLQSPGIGQTDVRIDEIVRPQTIEAANFEGELSPQAAAALRGQAIEQVPARFQAERERLTTDLQRRGLFGSGNPIGGEAARLFSGLGAAQESERARAIRERILAEDEARRNTSLVNSQFQQTANVRNAEFEYHINQRVSTEFQNSNRFQGSLDAQRQQQLAALNIGVQEGNRDLRFGALDALTGTAGLGAQIFNPEAAFGNATNINLPQIREPRPGFGSQLALAAVGAGGSAAGGFLSKP